MLDEEEETNDLLSQCHSSGKAANLRPKVKLAELIRGELWYTSSFLDSYGEEECKERMRCSFSADFKHAWHVGVSLSQKDSDPEKECWTLCYTLITSGQDEGKTLVTIGPPGGKKKDRVRVMTLERHRKLVRIRQEGRDLRNQFRSDPEALFEKLWKIFMKVKSHLYALSKSHFLSRLRRCSISNADMLELMELILGHTIDTSSAFLIKRWCWLLSLTSEEQVLYLCGQQFQTTMVYVRDFQQLSAPQSLRLFLSSAFGMTANSFARSYRVYSGEYSIKEIHSMDVIPGLFPTVVEACKEVAKLCYSLCDLSMEEKVQLEWNDRCINTVNILQTYMKQESLMTGFVSSTTSQRALISLQGMKNRHLYYCTECDYYCHYSGK